MEGLLEIGARVLVVPHEEISVPNVVEGRRLITLVAHVALDLQRFLEKLQCLVVAAAVVVEVAEIIEGVRDAFLVSNLPPDLERLVKARLGGLRLAQPALDLGNLVETEGHSTLLA